MSDIKNKAKKEREIEKMKRRRKISKKQQRKRKLRMITRVCFRVSLFLALVVGVSVFSYRGISNALREHQTKVQVSNQKIFEIEELQLVLNEKGSLVRFYIEQKGEENKMVSTELDLNDIRFRARKDHPTPYLRVVCDNDSEVCELEQAKEIIFFINKEDISGLEVN